MSDSGLSAIAAAERLFAAVEEGRVEELRQIFAPGARVWHNTDNKSIGVDESIRSIRALLDRSVSYRYTEIKREPTPTGFVQQHVLLITLKNGQEIVDRACCVCSVANGRVGHMDAYHDSAAFKVPGFGG